jgi:glutamyl-tRNA synthetase
MTVITRFAPSPTGYLHIGGARTALFNYLYARHMGGKFLLRIEDTDRARSTQPAVDALLQGLKWMGIQWDNEPIFQFARAPRHAEVAHQLVKDGKAYYCYTSQEELEAFRTTHPNEKFRSPWRNGGAAPTGAKPVIRIKAPLEGAITVRDHVRGEVSVEAKELDDMVLLRADGTPTYMLAVVVDDHDMGITHIIRGDDHFTNSFRQRLVYDAMGWNVPEFAHIPLIHGADGAKLSKRHGALGIEQYEALGYLPEAMRNYLLRLGWSHGDDEIISDAEAIKWFDLNGIGASPARLDIEKLNSVNHHYMKQAEPERLAALLGDAENKTLITALPWLVERASTLLELGEQAAFITAARPLTLTEKAAALVATAEAQTVLGRVASMLGDATDWSEATLKTACEEYMANNQLKPKQFMPVLRAALSGKEASAGSIYQIMHALGRNETLGRIKDLC